jgi:hypothetical protein
MKLFEIEIQGNAYVLAENEIEAQRIFERECSGYELRDLLEICAYDPGSTVIGDWVSSYPYGKNPDGKTVGELIDEKNMADKKARAEAEYLKRQRQLF